MNKGFQQAVAYYKHAPTLSHKQEVMRLYRRFFSLYVYLLLIVCSFLLIALLNFSSTAFCGMSIAGQKIEMFSMRRLPKSVKLSIPTYTTKVIIY